MTKKLNAGLTKKGRPWYQVNRRFVSKDVYFDELLRVEREKELSRVAVFYERIRGTRIRRMVRRTFPLDISESEIEEDLLSQRQYERGGNFIIGIVSITTGELKPNLEDELERGKPGSSDVTP